MAGLPPVTTFEMHKNGLDCVQIFVRDVEGYESDVWVSRVPELRLWEWDKVKTTCKLGLTNTSMFLDNV